MGLQDVIFDIAAALDGKPEAKLFEEFAARANRIEVAYEELTRWANEIEKGRFFQRRIENGDHRHMHEAMMKGDFESWGKQ